MADTFQEDGVTYRENYDNDPYEERYANIGLRRQPSLGPWLVMGLGIILMCFLAYLVYSNVLTPPVVLSSPELLAHDHSIHCDHHRAPRFPSAASAAVRGHRSGCPAEPGS
jgi:hypothetical protein